MPGRALVTYSRPSGLRSLSRPDVKNALEPCVENDGELLGLMSPLLQGRVALEANKQWLDRVWYLRAPPNRDDNFNSRMRTFYLAIAKNLAAEHHYR